MLTVKALPGAHNEKDKNNMSVLLILFTKLGNDYNNRALGLAIFFLSESRMSELGCQGDLYRFMLYIYIYISLSKRTEVSL